MNKITTITLLIPLLSLGNTQSLKAYPRHRDENMAYAAVGVVIGAAVVGFSWLIHHIRTRSTNYHEIISSAQAILAKTDTAFDREMRVAEDAALISNPSSRLHFTLGALGKEPQEVTNRLRSTLKSLEEQQQNVSQAIRSIESDKNNATKYQDHLAPLKTLSSALLLRIKALSDVKACVQEIIPLHEFSKVHHQLEISYNALIHKNLHPDGVSYSVLNDMRIDINNKGRGNFPYHAYLKSVDRAINELTTRLADLGHIAPEEAEGMALLHALEILKQNVSNTPEYAYERQVKFQIEQEQAHREHIERVQKQDHAHREKELKIHLGYDEAKAIARNAQADLAVAQNELRSLHREVAQYQNDLNTLNADKNRYAQQINELRQAIKERNEKIHYYESIIYPNPSAPQL